MRSNSVRAVAACLPLFTGCAERALSPWTTDLASADKDALRLTERGTPVLDERVGRAIDLLFVIDDSGSMGPKQWSLRQRFPALLARMIAAEVDGPGFDLHIGVVTSDLGAPGLDCGYGQGGHLLRIGPAAASDCQPLRQEPYLSYQTRSGASNTPVGQGVIETFACMAAVGELGCGYEMPLESAYRTLTGPEAGGFLRPDALLAVIFVTDEDDCSVDDPDSDLFATSPALGPLNSFRCARYGLVCDGAMLPGSAAGPFSSCRPATASEGGKLAALDKYERLLSRSGSQGGIKNDPKQVIVASLSGPTAPVSVVAAQGHAVCGLADESCAQIAHSCGEGTRYADPAVRLQAVLEDAPRTVRASICEDDYAGFFEGLADELARP